jgi:hypothetical protein
LVQGRAYHGVSTHADPLLTGIELRTQVFVIAGETIFPVRIGALAGERVANSGDVALVQGRAYHGVSTHADPLLTGIELRTQVFVIAGETIFLVRIGALAGERVANSGDVALVQGRAYHGVCTHADPLLTGIELRTQVFVIAREAIFLVRTGTLAGERVADTRDVALVQGRAYHGVCTHADPLLTGIHLSAGVAVIAGSSVVLRLAATALVAHSLETQRSCRAVRRFLAGHAVREGLQYTLVGVGLTDRTLTGSVLQEAAVGVALATVHHDVLSGGILRNRILGVGGFPGSSTGSAQNSENRTQGEQLDSHGIPPS